MLGNLSLRIKGKNRSIKHKTEAIHSAVAMVTIKGLNQGNWTSSRKRTKKKRSPAASIQTLLSIKKKVLDFIKSVMNKFNSLLKQDFVSSSSAVVSDPIKHQSL